MVGCRGLVRFTVLGIGSRVSTGYSGLKIEVCIRGCSGLGYEVGCMRYVQL